MIELLDHVELKDNIPVDWIVDIVVDKVVDNVVDIVGDKVADRDMVDLVERKAVLEVGYNSCFLIWKPKKIIPFTKLIYFI